MSFLSETNVNNMKKFIQKYIFCAGKIFIIQICGLIIHIILIRF